MSQLSFTNPLLDGLNPEQHDAVSTLNGPVQVIAAPGSGKTTVLTRRLAYLIQSGVRPENILAVTFTKKAATEMSGRVAKLVGKETASKLTAATFNSLGLKLLEGRYERLGFTVPKPHLLLESTQRSIFDVLLREHAAEDIRYEDLAAYISWAKSTLTSPNQVKRISADPNEGRMAALYMAYQKRLLKQNLIDFDDQIRLSIDLLQLHDDVRAEIQAQFTHVLVDEYQDTNKAQYTLLRLLAAPQNNLFAVGDDAQGIYGFRAADLDNILSFNRDFPDAKTIFLAKNYRSAPAIVKLANRLISHNAKQIKKTIEACRPSQGQKVRQVQAPDQFAEAQEVVAQIKELILQGTPPEEIAVLYRTHAQSAIVIEALISEEIPYVVKSSGSFWEQAEIVDMLNFLRLALHKPHPLADVAFENLLRRIGVSKESLSMLKVESEREEVSLWEAALRVQRIPLATLQQRSLVQHSVAMVMGWRKSGLKPADLTLKILHETGYKRSLEGMKGEKARQKLDTLSTLHEQIKRWNPESLYELFRQVENQTRPRKTKKTEAVQLLSIHASKGLEWEAVFVIGMEEGTLPYQIALDEGELSEERRLCYVAITRAKRYLQLSYVRERKRFGQKQSMVPSRFLAEMTNVQAPAS